MDPVSVKLFMKEPKEIKTAQDGADKNDEYVYERVTLKFRNDVLENWTETKKIHPDPLSEAIKAVDEAVKINADGKADKDIAEAIVSLKALELEAVMDYDKKNFKASHENFIKLLDLNKLPLMNNQLIRSTSIMLGVRPSRTRIMRKPTGFLKRQLPTI